MHSKPKWRTFSLSIVLIRARSFPILPRVLFFGLSIRWMVVEWRPLQFYADADNDHDGDCGCGIARSRRHTTTARTPHNIISLIARQFAFCLHNDRRLQQQLLCAYSLGDIICEMIFIWMNLKQAIPPPYYTTLSWFVRWGMMDGRTDIKTPFQTNCHAHIFTKLNHRVFMIQLTAPAAPESICEKPYINFECLIAAAAAAVVTQKDTHKRPLFVTCRL